MSDNILIDITTTQDNIGIEYFYPQGPAGPAGVNEWGTISGTLSTQTDLWGYLSAVGTSNFDIATLNNYLSTNNILLCSLNVNGQILSAGTDLFDIFLTSETDSQTLSYNNAGNLAISNGNNVTLSSFDTVNATNKLLSAGTDLFDIFLTSETDSQTLSYIPSSYLLSISNGNTVNLSSINSTFAANSAKYESVYTTYSTNSSKLINNGYEVELASTGQLNIPSSTAPGNNARIQSTEDIDILSNLQLWTFKQDGDLTFPDLTKQSTAFTNSYINQLTGNYTTVQSNSANWNSVYQTAITSVNDFTGHNITLNNYIYTTASQNVSSNRKYAFDTTTEILTAVLPPTPQAGDEIEFFDIFGTWNINPLVITNNTKRIEQISDNLNCNIRFGLIKLIYTNNNIGWRIVPMSRHSVPIINAPSVSIGADTDVGTLINFTGINNLDPEIGPVTNWYWNLTGGSTPDYFTQNVTYTYSTSGIYTVNLTGSNSAGIGTASRAITAVPLLSPVPAILASSFTGGIPFTVTLSGTNTLPVSSSPVTNWYWNLTGGNQPDYFTQNVTYTYSTSGTYLVTLTAANASGSGTTTQSITAFVENVPPGYLAFWKLDDTSDSSANANNLNNNNNVQFVAGKMGNCAEFNQTNYLDVNYNSLSPTFNPNGPAGEFTISCWVYPHSFSNYQAFLGSEVNGFIIHTDSGGNLYCNEAGSGDAAIYSILQLNQWQHIVFVKSLDGNTRVWYNGTKVYDDLTGNINNYQPQTNITLGNMANTSFPYDGKLDMVGLWNRELTEQEIQTLYNDGNGAEP